MVLPRVHNIMNSWYYSELNKYTKCWLYVNLNRFKFYMDAMFYHHSQLKKYRQNQEDHSNLLSISFLGFFRRHLSLRRARLTANLYARDQ